MSESLSVKDKVDNQNCPVSSGSLTMKDLNNNCLTSHSKSLDSSDKAPFETGNRKTDSDRQCGEQERKRDQNENKKKDQQENQNIFQSEVLMNKIKILEGKLDDSVSKKKKNYYSDRKSRDRDTWQANKDSEDTQKSRCDYGEIMKRPSYSGRCESEKESKKKLKPSKESSKEESFSFDSSDKYSKMLKLVNVKDERSGISRSSETQNRKRKNSSTERNEHKQEYQNKDNSKHKNKKAKTKHKHVEYDSDRQEPSVSFESYLNYDVNVFKRKEWRGVKKPPKKIKNDVKEEATKVLGFKSFKSPVISVHTASPKQVHLIYDLKSFVFTMQTLTDNPSYVRSLRNL